VQAMKNGDLFLIDEISLAGKTIIMDELMNLTSLLDFRGCRVGEIKQCFGTSPTLSVG
jgi:hypothetical protein